MSVTPARPVMEPWPLSCQRLEWTRGVASGGRSVHLRTCRCAASRSAAERAEPAPRRLEGGAGHPVTASDEPGERRVYRYFDEETAAC